MQDISLYIPTGGTLTFMESFVVSLQLLVLCRQVNCILHSLHQDVSVSVL